MEPTLIFMFGPPAAGKTTYSTAYCKTYPGFVRISADEIRQDLYGSQDIYGDPETIYKLLLAKMRDALQSGRNVIYDATNLRKDWRMDYMDALSDIECRKIIKVLPIDRETAKKRHEARGRNIPWSDLDPFFDRIEFPTQDEGWDKIEVVL